MTLPTLEGRPHPLILLAHPDPCYISRASQAFRACGWDVQTARTALEVRRLVRKLPPAAVVLAAQLREESGWLTCDKLVRQQPGLKVFLVEANPTAESYQFAEFVGAAGVLPEADDASLLVDEALGGAVAAS